MDEIADLIQELYNEYGRGQAADRLAEIGKPAVSQLISAMSIPEIADTVAVIIWSIGKPAVAPLIEAMKDASYPLWLAIGKCLKDMPPDWVFWPLFDSLERPEFWIKLGVIYSMADQRYRGSAIVPRLVEMTKDQDARIRGGAIGALGEIGDTRALVKLRWLVANDDESAGSRTVAQHAREAIKRIEEINQRRL